jgi:hypothetical protein
MEAIAGIKLSHAGYGGAFLPIVIGFLCPACVAAALRGLRLPSSKVLTGSKLRGKVCVVFRAAVLALISEWSSASRRLKVPACSSFSSSSSGSSSASRPSSSAGPS